jgi:hypothetical protein
MDTNGSSVAGGGPDPVDTAVANSVLAGGAIAVGLTYTMLSSWGFFVGFLEVSDHALGCRHRHVERLH